MQFSNLSLPPGAHQSRHGLRLARLIGAALAVLLLLTMTAPAYAAARVKSSQTFSVSTSDELQAALDAARAGDVIEITPGARLVGNFTLPKKPAVASSKPANWITIRTSAPDDALPPAGSRITPADASALAQIISPNAAAALRTEAGAHHYRLIGIEFTIAPDVMSNQGIVQLGDGNETDVQMLPHDLSIDRCYIHGHAVADIKRGIALNSGDAEIINCNISDIHGIGFDTQAICGWNGTGPYHIINNYLEASGENVLFGGADPTIPNLVPADIEFRRNDCSKPLAWKDGILSRPANVVATALSGFGNMLPAGATVYYRIAARTRAGFDATATSAASTEIAVPLGFDQTSVGLVWDAVELAGEYRVYRTTDAPDAQTRNWVYYTTTGAAFTDIGDPLIATASTPPEQATRWSVKNIFELKNARRVIIDGNLFENNWVDAQSGFAILFTVRNQDGKADWVTIEDMTFTNNIVRHTAAGVNILGRDDNHPSGQARDLVIRNNLFYDVGGAEWGGNGRFLQISDALRVTFDRNTVLQTGNIITAYGPSVSGFAFTNNLAPNNDFGVIGDGTSSGNATIDQYLPASAFKRNAIVGGRATIYPKKNLFPTSIDEVRFVDPAAGNFRLAASSPLKNAGTKGRDIGANIDAIEQARGVASVPAPQ